MFEIFSVSMIKYVSKIIKFNSQISISSFEKLMRYECSINEILLKPYVQTKLLKTFKSVPIIVLLFDIN